MAGRIGFSSEPSDYPPFLPRRPIEVDPHDPESFTLPNIHPDVLAITGPLIQPMPTIPPNILPPPPPGFGPINVQIPTIGPQTPFDGLFGIWGDIAIRGPQGWIRLGPGTAGQVLKTKGQGALPIWEDA